MLSLHWGRRETSDLTWREFRNHNYSVYGLTIFKIHFALLVDVVMLLAQCEILAYTTVSKIRGSWLWLCERKFTYENILLGWVWASKRGNIQNLQLQISTVTDLWEKGISLNAEGQDRLSHVSCVWIFFPSLLLLALPSLHFIHRHVAVDFQQNILRFELQSNGRVVCSQHEILSFQLG